ncbi:MAG TPA: alpha/beta fold hydrolase [Gemmatimonadaceae bacterium]|nr:alpha/beta fold hydrolase [Gemmatimonadaceae bacterium]
MTTVTIVGLVVLASALYALRWRHVRTLTTFVASRAPLGPDGIVIGAEGFVLARPGAPATLLLHGAGDTPQTLRYLADRLFERGYHVEAPLLPGHGRTPAAFARLRADDLTDAANVHYARLRERHEWVGVVGLSMGGALAVQVAATAPELPALGLVAPYLAMPPAIERAAALSWIWGPIVPLVRSGDGLSVLDPSERQRSLAYGVFTPAALRALRETVHRAAAALPRVMAPTLVVNSRGDNRITMRDAEAAFARLGADEKRLEWIEGAAHVITVDYGREKVFDMLADWMDSHRAVSS